MTKEIKNFSDLIEKRLTSNVSKGDTSKIQFKFLMLFTELGSSFGAIVIFGVMFIFEGANIFPLIIIYLIQLAIVECIKFIFKTPRPRYLKNHKNIFGFDTTSSSFPSGHTANAYAMAFLITHYYQTGTWVSLALYLIALGISVSRIYLGKHYIVDIIGGMVIGLSVSIISWDMLFN